MTTATSPLARVPIFAHLTAAELAALDAELRPRRYAAGAVIFQRGDAGDALYVVVAGEVAIVLSTPDGKELTLALLGPGDAFGELALLDGAPRSADAVARTAARLLLLSRAAALRRLAARPEAALSAMAALSRLVRRTNRLVYDLAFLEVRARLARVLWEQAEARGEPGPGGLVALPRLTQSELAALTGVTRESVNKWLGRFAKLGVLRRAGRRLLVDPGRLRLEVE